MSAAEFEFEIDDHKSLLRSSLPAPDPDPEAAQPGSAVARRNGAIGDLLRHLDRGLSGNRRSIRRPPDRAGSPLPLLDDRSHDALGDGAPPEWALLLIGCLLGLATGLCVAAFSRGVHVIHEWAWAGTPNEGAAWLRLQRLADTWHRILLIPVTGGVVVGMMHGLLEIFEQIKQSRSSRPSVDFLSAIFPTIKAIQAAVTLGTGCSLGPEGPSVDIGKSCAYGCSEMMENNRERRIALVAAGAAAGIASGRKFLRCKLDGCSRFIWMDNAMKEKEKLEACYPKEKHEACDPKEKLNANKGKLKITIEGTVNEVCELVNKLGL